MPISDYIRILWRRGWIMVLLAVLTAGSAFVFSTIQTPIYQSAVNILIQPSRMDFGLTQSAKILLDSHVAYLDTNVRAQEVIDALELDTTPEVLRSDVRIASQLERFVISIEVENENGDLANDIARRWAELLVQYRNERNQEARREDRVEALILDEPRFTLDRPKKGVNTAAGGILGLLLGGVIVFILEYVESGIVRSRQDVERYLELSVLGVIPAYTPAKGGASGAASARRD